MASAVRFLQLNRDTELSWGELGTEVTSKTSFNLSLKMTYFNEQNSLYIKQKQKDRKGNFNLPDLIDKCYNCPGQQEDRHSKEVLVPLPVVCWLSDY